MHSWKAKIAQDIPQSTNVSSPFTLSLSDRLKPLPYRQSDPAASWLNSRDSRQSDAEIAPEGALVPRANREDQKQIEHETAQCRPPQPSARDRWFASSRRYFWHPERRDVKTTSQIGGSRPSTGQRTSSASAARGAVTAENGRPTRPSRAATISSSNAPTNRRFAMPKDWRV